MTKIQKYSLVLATVLIIAIIGYDLLSHDQWKPSQMDDVCNNACKQIWGDATVIGRYDEEREECSCREPVK